MLKSDIKGDVSGSHEDGGEGQTTSQSARTTRARKEGQGIEHTSILNYLNYIEGTGSKESKRRRGKWSHV